MGGSPIAVCLQGGGGWRLSMQLSMKGHSSDRAASACTPVRACLHQGWLASFSRGQENIASCMVARPQLRGWLPVCPERRMPPCRWVLH